LGNYIFTPTDGFEGKAYLNYAIKDTVLGANNATDTAQLVIIVYGGNGVANDPPFAGDDYAITNIGQPITASWAANDYEYNADSIKFGTSSKYVKLGALGQNPDSLFSATTQQGGKVTFYSNGNYVYTPPTGYIGPDQVAYQICDKSSNEPQPLCDSATIYLSVGPLVRDYGDLPVSYGAAWNVYIDTDTNGIPEGTLPMWLGAKVTNELASKPSSTADLDSDDGVIIPSELDTNGTSPFKIIVNSTVPNTDVYYKMWIDWDMDGKFDTLYSGKGTTHSPDTVTVNVSTPSGEDGSFYLRVRVGESLASIDSVGIMMNGETEDYIGNLTPVPVKLIKFIAFKKDNIGKLEWTTASEINNDYFEIQKSLDAANWNPIGTVQGQGNTSKLTHYYFDDLNLVTGVNYYRLKQIDFDGKFEYSEVRLISTVSSNSMIVYPNPTRDELNVTLKGTARNKSINEIIITDELGRILSLDYKQITADNSVEYTYDFSLLTAGVYFITLHHDNVIETKRIVVLR
jgi:hypothetical protein